MNYFIIISNRLWVSNTSMFGTGPAVLIQWLETNASDRFRLKCCHRVIIWQTTGIYDSYHSSDLTCPSCST